MRNRFRLLTRAVATALTVAVAGATLAACSGQNHITPGSPIKVAAISSDVKSASHPEVAQAADAVFQEFNKRGGLNGQPIELSVYGDQGTAQGAVQAANQAIAERAIAFIGSSSSFDGSNTAFYERQGTAVVNQCVEQACFTSPNIAPVNTGPFYETYAELYFASTTLKQKSMCAVLFADETPSKLQYNTAFANWSAQTGQTFTTVLDLSAAAKPDYAAAVTALKNANCDGIWSNADPASMLALIKAAEIKFYKEFTFLGLSSLYTPEFLASLTWVGAGLYAPANYTPFTESEDVSNYGWLELMTAYGVPATQYAQAGYLAATAFIETLKTMGSTKVTKQSVLAAFQAQSTPITNAMWGNPWTFGPAKQHQPNVSVWPVAVLPASLGTWTSVGPWLRANEID